MKSQIETDLLAKRKRELEQLRHLAKERCRQVDLFERIEALVGSAIGAPVSHLSSDPIVPQRHNLAGYLRIGRTHTRHVLRVSGRPDPRWARLIENGRIAVFAKMCAELAPSVLDDALNFLDSPDFITPHAFGVCSKADVSIGAWSYYAGKRTTFEQLSAETQTRLVRAVAGVNALRANGLSPRIRWMSASLHRIDHHYRGLEPDLRERWAVAHERIVRFHHQKKRIVAAMREDPPTLAHNDFNPNNFFAPVQGPICVYDWEKATRSVPGADLGFLALMAHREPLLSCYIERMGELGFRLDRERVIRTFEVVEGSRLIQRGWGNRSLSMVEQGLGLAEPHA